MARPPAVPVTVTRGVQSGTSFIRCAPARPVSTLPPVVILHGTAAYRTQEAVIGPFLAAPSSPFAVDRHAYRALLATGRTLYFPWLGNNFGTGGPGVPNLGGTGYQSVDAMITQAAADGLAASTVDLWGTSGGALTGLNWAWRNPAALHAMFAQSPGVDLSHAYDCDAISEAAGLGKISEQMRAVHGGDDKASWLPLAEPFDPTRQRPAIAPIADRITVFSARDDELVPWATVESMHDDLAFRAVVASNGPGLPGGGHWTAPTYPGWNDLLPLRALTDP